MKSVILTIVGLACYAFSAHGQIQITGKVTASDDGLPLPQVTVLLKGTKNGTPTNADGEYQITVPNQQSVLVFRYLGYVTQEITVHDKTRINVQLSSDTQSLGEVVVAAYGIPGSSRGIYRTPRKQKVHVNESYAKTPENAFQRIDLELVSNSKYKGKANYKQVMALSATSAGADENGVKSEFRTLVRKASLLSETENQD